MATAFTYGGMAGPYLHITNSDKTVDFIIPYTADITVSTSQQTIKPIQQLQKYLSEVVDMAAKLNPLTAAGKELYNVVRDTLGLKLHNRLFYAQAWAGSEPTQFSVNLQFNIGGKDEWKGKTEVLDPIYAILNATLPDDNGIIMTSPMPNGYSVFTDYTAQAIKGFSDQIGKVVNILGGDGETNAAASATTKRTWEIKVGYVGKGKSVLDPFFIKIPGLIVKSAAPTFSLAALDEGGCPIKGSISLSMETQSIPVSGIFNTDTTASKDKKI